jgi:Arc/MetJ family transcription regulator
MKTTVEISDALLAEARRAAEREQTTVRALIEAGLRRVLAERARKQPFRLRPASFKGRGLQPDVESGSWSRLRDLAYEGRGA